jgi:hypothetical protein
MSMDAHIMSGVPADNQQEISALTLRSAVRAATVGRAVALAALPFLAWTTFWPPDGVSAAALTAAGSAALFVGVVLAVWVDHAEILFDSPRFVRRFGPGPLARRKEIDLRDASAVVVMWRERTDLSGQPDVTATLGVRLHGEILPLLRGFRDERVEQMGAAIADGLHKPLQIETVPAAVAATGRFASRFVALLLWGGLLVVSGIMLKPLFSAKPPTGLLLAQPRSALFAPSFSQGQMLFRDGRFAEAEAMFGQATRESPRDSESLNMLAYAQAEQNKLDQALNTAHEALKAAPGSANIIDTVGEMHERRREYKQAENYYLEALKGLRVWESCETHTKLARTLIALHRPSESIPHLQAALHYPRQPWSDLAARLLHRVAPGQRIPLPAAPFIRGFRRP